MLSSYQIKTLNTFLFYAVFELFFYVNTLDKFLIIAQHLKFFL